MRDDLLQTLLYVVIGLAGVIVSAYRNKQKKNATGNVPPVMKVPRNMEAEPQPFQEPDLGPLMELFNIPHAAVPDIQPGTVESGPTVEETGMLVDSPESASELEGMKVAEEAHDIAEIPDSESFEEGQSDIQKQIARYDAIRRELEKEYGDNDIAAGEIVSVETAEAAQAVLPPRERLFDPRKAIIYSEILKRREY